MISVVIVTFNSARCIGECLRSLEAAVPAGSEVIVVDNASRDGTRDAVRAFPFVRLLENAGNAGFAAACNQGARQSRGDILLFLNPDCFCRTPLAPLEAALAPPQVVAAGARLVDDAGRPQVGFNVRRLPTAASLVFEVLLVNRLFPTNPVNRRYRCLDVDLSRSASVEQPAGACLAVKRSAFERCGGFDEHFAPLWFEDVDLCKRLREAGGEIVYCPEVVVRHAGGHSVALLSPPEKQVYWYRNLLYYVHKHFRWCTGLIIRSALLFGAGMRMAAEVAGMFVSRDTPRGVRADRVRSYWRAAELSFLEWPRR